MRTATPLCLAAALAAASVAPAALAQTPTYEPQQRLRASGLDTCTRSEVMNNAWCVKKCEAGFRMDLAGPKPRCIGLRADAKHTPAKPDYQPPPADPGRKPPPGA